MEAVTLEAIYSEIRSLQAALIKPKALSVGVVDAAEMIGVSKTTMYKLIENYEIKYSVVGGRMVIKIKEIESYLTEREVAINKRRK